MCGLVVSFHYLSNCEGNVLSVHCHPFEPRDTANLVDYLAFPEK